jgi:hypothetical protein
MRVDVSSEASQGVLNFFLPTGMLNRFNCEFLGGFCPFSVKIEFRNFFSFFEEGLFGVFGARIVIDASVTLGFADDLLVDERGGFGPAEHFVLDVEVLEFLVDLGLLVLEESSET